MNALKKHLTLALILILTLCLLVPMAAYAAEESGDDGKFINDKSQISARQMPIAVDYNGGLQIDVSLAYKSHYSVAGSHFTFFTIEPVIDEDMLAVLEFGQSAYTQYLGDLIVITNEQGNWAHDYFRFNFGVKKDAINGTYTMNFKVKFLSKDSGLHTEIPAEATIPVLFRIENGKKPPSTPNPDKSEPSQNPSKAMLLLESTQRNPETIVAGEEFDLTLKFRNTTKKTITDVRGTISDELMTLLPANGSNTLYIEKVEAGETAEYTLRVTSTPNAGIQPAVLNISYSFVQSNVAYDSTDSVTIPVSQLPNLSIDAPYYSNEIFEGDSVNLMMNLFNKGRSTIYNVTVSLDCPGLTAEETYFAGNMDAGITKSYDVMAYADPGITGQVQGNIIVTYEDNYGNENRKEVPINLNILAMDYGMDDMGDMGVMEPMPMEPESSGIPMWLWIAIGAGAVAVAAVVVIVIVVRKRKKAKELEDEMD